MKYDPQLAVVMALVYGAGLTDKKAVEVVARAGQHVKRVAPLLGRSESDLWLAIASYVRGEYETWRSYGFTGKHRDSMKDRLAEAVREMALI